MNSKPDPTYTQLVAEGEPFRLLFPVGMFFGLVGVLLWPMYSWNLIETYPLIAHTRIMIECFMGAFVIGFLGTALPRLLDVPKVHGTESSLYMAGMLIVFGAHLASQHILADTLFLVILGTFVLGLVIRFQFRKDIPPPAFVLVFLGMACALIGTVCLVISQLLNNALSLQFYQASRLLLYQGFLLFPTMGVGAFLLPRFFELPNKQNFPETLTPSKEWWHRAAFALSCGMLGLVSFALEFFGYLRAAYVLRAAIILVYFSKEVPIYKARFSIGSLAFSMRIALLSIPLGYLAMAIMPERQITLLHIVFISGFSLLTLTVATRVIFGHGGNSELFKRPLWSIRIIVALVALAMVTRVSADWMPDIRMTHYGYAALAWVIAAIIWSIKVLPGVRHPDD